MTLRLERAFVAAGLMTLLIAGCDSAKPPANQPPVTAAPKGAKSNETVDSQKPIAKADGQINPAGSPVDAVRNLLDGLSRQNPKVVWDFLPAGYQRDINSVVHEFADAGNSETWKWSFRLAEDSSRLLKSKKAFFLSYPRLKESKNVNSAELEKNWEPTIGLFDTLLVSDLADPEKLRTIDFGTFLEKTGGRLMSQLAEISKTLPNDQVASQFGRQFSGMKVDLVSQQGDKAVLKLTPADPKVPPTDANFVLVEGKWIPQSLADGWKPAIEQARERITAMKSDSGAQPSANTAVALSQIESTIAELQQIEDEGEFHKRLDSAITTLSSLLQNPPPSADATNSETSTTAGSPTAEDSATIVIDGRLGKEKEETLCNHLTAIVDDENLAIAEAPNFSQGRTTIRAWPVKDVAAFAKRIDFAHVVNVDAAAKVIVVELNNANGDAK